MRKPAYRDGLESWTEGEVFTTPAGEVVEVLYTKPEGGKKLYFVELPGAPACAHGDSLEEAIEEAKAKQYESAPLTEEEKQKYRAEGFKFSVPLFKRITRACSAGVRDWLEERGLDTSVKMTLPEFRKAGGGQWADALEEALRND